MRQFRFSFFACLSVAFRVLLSAPIAAINFADRCLASVTAWAADRFDFRSLDLGLDDRRLAYEGFVDIDPALQSSLRHEAGMRPLRC